MRIILQICLAFCILIVSACENDFITDIGNSPDVEVEDTTEYLKVLCIGNSFTEDAFGYLPYIMKNLTPDINLKLGVAYYGSSTLAHHYASIKAEDCVVGNDTFPSQPYQCYYKNVNAGVWQPQYGVYAIDVLIDEKWDIITFQQGSAHYYSDFDIYYKSCIDSIQQLVVSKIGYEPVFGWVLTHGVYLEDNADIFYRSWEKSAQNSRKVIEDGRASLLFPYGTAVENLRTRLGMLGDGSYFNLTADNFHLQDGIGCLAAAYSNALALYEYLGIYDVGIEYDSLVVDYDFLANNDIPSLHLGISGIIGITPENVRLAKSAAIEAVKQPYSVTYIKDADDSGSGEGDGTGSDGDSGEGSGDEGGDSSADGGVAGGIGD